MEQSEWRDYVWHCSWYFGERYPRANALAARRSLPSWFWDLDADHVRGLSERRARRRA